MPPACTRSASFRSIRRARGSPPSGCGRLPGRHPIGSATWWSRSPAGCAPPRGWPSGRPRSRQSTSLTSRRTPTRRAHRLAFEELFLLELALAGRKRARAERARARELPGTGELVDPWLTSLPFTRPATSDERSTRIDRDIATATPMQRLLMGEVGSGKTVVALAAMLRAVESGAQAAFMAPTETLAEQHMATIDRLLGGHVPVALLTGSTPAAPAEGDPRPARLGRARDDRRHARADRAGRRLPRARARRGGRAAPLRRAPAGRARREGLGRAGAARPAHDRDADPADARADRLRRPRRDDPARAAGRTPPGRDARGGRGAGARPRVRADPRGDREGAPVLRRLPAGRGVRDAPGEGGDRRGGAAGGAPSSATSASS